MTTTPLLSPTPPRWPHALLRAVLPDDSMGDAILGDLHEEHADDVARLGVPAARLLYAQRAAGILAHALLDALRRRGWASRAAAAAWPCAETTSRVASPAATHPRRARARAAGGGAALAAAVFAVLALGIVANMALYGAAHGTAGPVAHASSARNTTLGVGAVVLSVASAFGAAVLLCAGPRWLLRRLRHA